MEQALGTRTRAPMHFWIVAGIALLWNAYGAFDYTMTNLRNPAYLANVPPDMMSYIDSMPVWATTAWALGVWGGLAGAVLLLLRSRYAVAAFAVSLLGLAVATLYQWTMPQRPEWMTDPSMLAMNAVIWAGVIFFLLYALAMRRRGVIA